MFKLSFVYLCNLELLQPDCTRRGLLGSERDLVLQYIGLTEETCYCTKVRQERHVTVHRSDRRDMLLYIGLTGEICYCT